MDKTLTALKKMKTYCEKRKGHLGCCGDDCKYEVLCECFTFYPCYIDIPAIQKEVERMLK